MSWGHVYHSASENIFWFSVAVRLLRDLDGRVTEIVG